MASGSGGLREGLGLDPIAGMEPCDPVMRVDAPLWVLPLGHLVGPLPVAPSWAARPMGLPHHALCRKKSPSWETPLGHSGDGNEK